MPYKYVEVEVLLEDFNDEDLVTELKARGFTVVERGASADPVTIMEDLYYALRDKDHNKIYSLSSKLVAKSIGRIV